MAAVTHPFFKANWIDDPQIKEDAKVKLKQLLNEAVSPVYERSASSLTDDFLNSFNQIQTNSKPDEADFFMRDPNTSMAMLDNYPQIKLLFLKYNCSIPTSAPVERLFSQAALVLTVRRNRLSDCVLEMLILLKIALCM